MVTRVQRIVAGVMVAGVLTAIAVTWPKPSPKPVAPVPSSSNPSVPKPPAPTGPIGPGAMIPAPLPPSLAVRYALPEAPGDLGSTGLRSREPSPLTAAEQEIFDRFRRAASVSDGLPTELRLFGDRSPPRVLSAWDEVLERWVDPRLKKEDGLGWFRPDAAYEEPRAPLQQRESGFNIGIKYRWSF